MATAKPAEKPGRTTAAERMRIRRANLPPGTCINCTIRPARPGRKSCEACGAAAVASAAKRKQNLIAKGICGDCKVRKARPGHVTCAKCASAERFSGEAGRVRNARAAEKRGKPLGKKKSIAKAPAAKRKAKT